MHLPLFTSFALHKKVIAVLEDVPQSRHWRQISPLTNDENDLRNLLNSFSKQSKFFDFWVNDGANMAAAALLGSHSSMVRFMFSTLAAGFDSLQGRSQSG